MIKKVSLVDQIYAQTRSDIINLEYPLGSRLSISNLQEKYDVSSTPVREALNRLQNEGLVCYENNVGATVISLTEKDVNEIQELAIVLHKAAIRFSMFRGDKKKMADEMKKYITLYENASTVAEQTNSVHNIVGVFYKNCGNERLDANMQFIQGQQLILRSLYGQKKEHGSSNLDNFLEMYEGVVTDDVDRVIAALEENARRATVVLLKIVSE